MNSLQLLNLTFKRICEIASMCGLVIRELPSGEINVRLIKDDNWNSWKWKNKEQFLIGNGDDASLFLFICNEYQCSYLKDKINLRFIDLCEILKSCESIEELMIKMDLIGI
jgi:hypothetical protein